MSEIPLDNLNSIHPDILSEDIDIVAKTHIIKEDNNIDEEEASKYGY